MSNNSMTSEPITPNHIQQTLFAGDFLANQSQIVDTAKGSQRLQSLVCGMNSTESFAYYDRDTSSWKTSQQSFLEDLESFSETWPRQGITVNGVAYQRRMLEPVTRETGFGLLPTVRASEPGSTSHGYGDNLKEGICKQMCIPTKKYPLHGETHLTSSKEIGENGVLNPSFVELLMGFPLGWTELKD